jgi:hypothetical protein
VEFVSLSGITMPTLQHMLEMLAALLGELILFLLGKIELIKMLGDH